MLAGLVLKSRPFGRALKAAVGDRHRTGSSRCSRSARVAVHGTTLVLDSTVQIGPSALLVPGLAPYRPVWTGLGVVAAELWR